MRQISILLLCLSVLLTGCTKIVRSEEIEIQATIKGTYHRDAYTECVNSGSSIINDEVNTVSLEYDDEIYTLHGIEYYQYCLDRIGSVVSCTLVIDYYDDGSTKKRIKNVLYE